MVIDNAMIASRALPRIRSLPKAQFEYKEALDKLGKSEGADGGATISTSVQQAVDSKFDALRSLTAGLPGDGFWVKNQPAKR